MAPLQDREAFSGTVERVTFHSPETGFCVLRVKSRGRREPVTVVGVLAAIQAGETIQASGRWDQHRDHGLQFKADFLKAVPPNTLEGIERYLGSGMIKGIGPNFAKRLVKAFGTAVFDVIENTPQRLAEVDGIGPLRIGLIQSAWGEQKAVREIMLFLQSHGVSTARAVRIYKTYGADAIPLVTDNPYRLARDIRGIGFKTADQIAQQLGIEKSAMLRARAGISYALQEAVSEGHCALPESELLPRAEALLEIPAARLLEALALELAEGVVLREDIAGQPCIFLPPLRLAEQTVAARLAKLTRHPLPWPAINAERAIPWVENKLGVTLSPGQRHAIEAALATKLLVITGGPGVGKTTLVKSILAILATKGGAIMLAAPTGRAAKRLAESTGREAKTLHRLLEFDPKNGGFKRGADHPLDCQLLVVDESSMIDMPLMAALLKALPDPAGLIIVGDVDQLPSVGPGQVLKDIIQSGTIAVARLSEIFRQAATSRIITNAHRINQGHLPDLQAPEDGLTDFYFVEAQNPEEGVARILELVKSRIPRRFGFDPLRDIQVLCPMNRGAIGARALNTALQQALNPALPGLASVERFGTVYRLGDKVMQIANNYDKEIFNGDIGTILAVDGGFSAFSGV